MDNESTISIPEHVATEQIPIINAPNMATAWACSECHQLASKELTKLDIRGLFYTTFLMGSAGTRFSSLSNMVIREIDWNYVYDYYRREVCQNQA